MASPKIRSTSEILQPIFDYLCEPDDAISIEMLKRIAAKFSEGYQRDVANGMFSLIDGDASSARVFFNAAASSCPVEQLPFVLSNAGVSFHAAKLYSDELRIAYLAAKARSPHLLRYSYFVSARRCDYDLFLNVVQGAKKLNVDIFDAGGGEINAMIDSAANALSILHKASASDRMQLKLAADIMHKLSEQEKLEADDIKVWVDDDETYGYGLYLMENDRHRYREINDKLDAMVLSSDLDFIRVTPVIFYGGE